MNEKNTYKQPKLEVVSFEGNDVVTASSNGTTEQTAYAFDWLS